MKAPKQKKTAAARTAQPQDRLRALQAQSRRDRQVQEALYRIADSLVASRALEEFYAAVHRVIGSLMYARNFMIVLHDKTRDILEAVYFVDTAGDPWPPARPKAEYARTPSAQVLETGKPLHASRSKLLRMMKAGLIQPVGSIPEDWLGVPLLYENETLGVIVTQSYERDRGYSPADVKLLSFVAQQIASLLVRARALEAERQRAAELQLINSVQEALASRLDMQVIYDLIGEKLRELFDAQSLFIIRYDPATDLCHFPYLFEKGARLRQEPIPPSGISGYVLRKRQAVMINTDMDKHEFELTGQPSRLLAGGRSSRSRLDVPLLVGDEARGTISLQNVDRENAFSDSDLRLLQTLASSMSVALENARLFDETQRLLREAKQHVAELEIINRVGEIMSSQLDAKTIIRAVGDKITEIFHAEATSILMLDAENGMIQPVYEWDEGKYITEMEPFPMGTGLTSRVIQTRQPLLLGTAEEAAAYGAYYPPEGAEVNPVVTQSYLGVPIIVGEKVIGVVSVHTYTRYAYGPDSLRLLSTLANNMGVALENARLFDETERLLKETEQRATELEIINDIAQELTRQLDLLPMIEVIGDKLRQVIQADSVGIGLFDAESGTLQAPYAYKRNERVHPDPIRMSEFSVRLARQGRTLVINKNTESRWARYGSNLTFGPEIPRSLVLVPILVGHELVGGITLQDFERESAFAPSTVRLIETIASNIGAAIQNARLFEETQRRNAEVSEALSREKATSAILKVIASSATDIQPVLDTIAATASRLLGSDDVVIGLVENGRLRIAAHCGDIPQPVVGESLELDHDTLSGRAILEGRSLQIMDATTTADEEFAAMRARAVEHGYRTIFSTPLVRDEDAIGSITIRRRAARLLTDKQIELIRTFADQTVIAIQNVHLVRETRRLLESEQQRAAELATVNTVSRALAAETNFDTLIQLVGEQVRMIFRCDVAFVALFDRENGLIRFPFQYGEESEPIRLGEGLVSKIIETGQPLLINRAIAEKRQELGVRVIGKQARSYLGVPILAGQQVIGAISVQSLTEEGRFDEGDQRLLGTIAANVGVAIQKARLFEEITHQKQFYQAVINNSPAAIVLLDMQANVTGWNPEAEKLFGYPAEEALGRNVDELVANNPLMRREAVQYSEQALSELKVKFISRRARKDGSLVDVEVSGLPVLVDDREVGFIAIYHDITELQRARQEAIAANEAKSAFLATMSHEIRTPMNAVIGMSGLLLDTDLNAEQRDYAETIRNSGDALLAIINDILDFSKIEAGRMDLEEQPFELRDCIESAVDLVAARAAEKGLDLAYQLEDDVPAGIRGDVTRLRQVLLNLLSNAVKFTEHGEVEMTVRRGDRPDELLFAVRDTGVGIRPSEMGRLFESFSQADSSTTRKYGGTGLGLAISKRLVELMSGRMWASSEGVPGKGSVFQFTIRAPEAPGAEKIGRATLRGPQPSLSGKRLLIVDDNDTNRRILSLQTSKWGMLPRVTGSPREALEWVRAGEQFDLAILDMQMPEMDGVALARALRDLRDAAALPLILLTSLGRREVEEGDPLFHAHLSKPVKPSSLHDALTTILAHARTVATASVRPTIDPEMARRHPLRVLLAEDNAVNQKLALRLLEQMGYRADVASNGLEAIQSLERQPYDVILMDVQMPVMDGLEATRQIIARWPASQRPWIIAMTANAMQGDREMCLAAGMNYYISKPIHVPELIAALGLVTRRD